MIAIIGVLTALLIPAVQSARESARASQCRSQLRQIALALIAFHDAYGRFPEGGWGRAWAPVPERGIGRGQPGGWAYQVQPFIEGAAAFRTTETAGSGAVGLLDTTIAAFNCPSRRSADLQVAGQRFAHQRQPRPGGEFGAVARGDYAINSGASHAFRLTGPPSLEVGDSAAFWRMVTDNRNFTGISHLRRSVGLRRVTDGASHTYLVGEKFLAPKHYETGQSIGDDEALFSGYAYDNHRFAASRLLGPAGSDPGLVLFYQPLRDTNESGLDPPGYVRFGSPHPAGSHMARCDGSVATIAYDIDPRQHYFGASRSDGGDLEL